MGDMAILDATGETKITWDASIKDEVREAERTFDSLKEKGYIAYSVKRNGDKGEVIKKFDPDAEMIIMSKRIVGG